jgi:hypothetical protein
VKVHEALTLLGPSEKYMHAPELRFFHRDVTGELTIKIGKYIQNQTAEESQRNSDHNMIVLTVLLRFLQYLKTFPCGGYKPCFHGSIPAAVVLGRAGSNMVIITNLVR